MNKKAQGVSITVIIIAAVALIVLVVLIAMFVGRMGIFGQEYTENTKIENCLDIEGATWEETCTGTIKYGAFKDESQNPGKTCCVKGG